MIILLSNHNKACQQFCHATHTEKGSRIMFEIDSEKERGKKLEIICMDVFLGKGIVKHKQTEK